MNVEKTNELKAELLKQETWKIQTQGTDPWIETLPLKEAIDPKHTVFTFDYFCPEGLDHFQIFFGPEFKEGHSKKDGNVGVAEGLVSFSTDVGREIGAWGKPGDLLRLDFGGKANVELQIRNIRFREMTVREKEILKNREEKLRQEAEMEVRIRKYLQSEHHSKLSRVAVDGSNVTIQGEVAETGEIYLCEVAPHQDVTEETEFDFMLRIGSGPFEKRVERFSERDGFKYDRILSKWVLAGKTGKGFQLLSHARHPDAIHSKYNYPKEVPASKKGLGGFSTGRGHLDDLDELGITSVTVNIWFSRFMFSKPAPGRIEHVYNGRSYYFQERSVAGLDKTFQATAERGIITATILLVDKAEKCPDPEIGRLLQHPDMDLSGIYSMPNMTNPASVDCYAAALDFLASRYSLPDKKYGRIHHWIMHNEIDAGWVWTNMGEKTAQVFMDTYLKSMRMCYAIARSYNPHAEVFISLAHRWTRKHGPNFYQGKDLMDILLDYTRAEGDFKWGMAYHPYPESLFEPKTWLDKKVDFTFETPLITFKNLEVLDAYIKRPELQYMGKEKRSLWLSENGTNSKTYSEKDLFEQAAGFAYTWKKLKDLDGIDGFQWHNWYDLRQEFGLKLGLRKYPDDEKDPGGKKPVWYVYQAAGRSNEDEVFDQYKAFIGVESWEDVKYKGEIREETDFLSSAE